jgi:hypothetical protein
MQILTIIAIAISPAIAVGVSIWVQSWKEKRQQKRYIFASLMSTRHQVISDEIVRALNMIDVVFYDKKKIRELWHEYYDMLHNEGLNNPLGWEQRNTKKLELITEMAKEVGFSKEITHIDVNRVYSPVGLAEDTLRMRETGIELLRVLKESGGLKIVPKEQSEKKTNK